MRRVTARHATSLRGCAPLGGCARQARVVTNLEHLNAADAAEGGEAAPMAELQHNLRLLVDLAEADLQRLDARLRQEKVRLLLHGVLLAHRAWQLPRSPLARH